MKKLLFLLMVCFTVSFAASAQDGKKQVDKTKVKKTSTVGQKIHNTVSKHKHYKGHKVKHKVENVKK